MNEFTKEDIYYLRKIIEREKVKQIRKNNFENRNGKIILNIERK